MTSEPCEGCHSAEKWRNNWILHHSNVHYHISHAVQQFLVKNQIPSIPPANIFSRCHSCNLWFFPVLKTGVKGHCFASVEEVQQKMTARPIAIPTEDFQRFFQQWQYCWNNCMCVQKGSTLRATGLGFIYILFIQIMHKFQEPFGPAMCKLNKGPAGKCSTNGLGTAYKFWAVLQLLFE